MTRINILESSNAVRINVRSSLNTFVDAFDWFTHEMVVIPLAYATPDASGGYTVKKGTDVSRVAL